MELIDNYSRAILKLFADDLSHKLRRSADEIRNNGLTAYDFSAGQRVEIRFEDGSSACFKHAFFISCPEKRLIAVFTEHCGYYLFPSLGTKVSQAPETFLETSQSMTSKKARQVVQVIERAIEVFENEGKALLWLNSPNLALGDVRPFDLLATREGVKKVLDVLVRIEHGILA